MVYASWSCFLWGFGEKIPRKWGLN
jgi:hypothetical protein